jgi:hypothetical protein
MVRRCTAPEGHPAFEKRYRHVYWSPWVIQHNDLLNEDWEIVKDPPP